MQDIGKIMTGVGVVIAIIGLLLWAFGDKFQWLGNLPGDIKIERTNFKFYMPITTMIFASVLISGILWLIRKFL